MRVSFSQSVLIESFTETYLGKLKMKLNYPDDVVRQHRIHMGTTSW